jgi:alpha-glucosidase (family GH31 glycosyl hydrolase)
MVDSKACHIRTLNNRVRISLLSPTLLRLEERGPEGFEDRPTFLVVDRDWPGVEFEERANPDTVRFVTPAYTVVAPAGAVRLDGIRVLSAGGEALFEGSQAPTEPPEYPDPRNPGLAWTLPDAPRVVPPPWGAQPPPDGAERAEISGWNLTNPARDVYVFAHGGNSAQWRADFLKLTGRIPLPPLWAFGFWNSLYYPYTEDEALAVVDEYRRRDFPLDVFVVDTDWRVGGSGGYEVEPRCFPDIGRFIERAHQKNVRLVFNDHPQPNGMKPLEPAMLEFRRRGLAQFLDRGLDAWWFDRNWPDIIDGPVAGIDCEVWGQYLYEDITRRARPERRALIMSMRSRHPASHRYPVWWTGDIHSTWEDLRQGVRDSVNDGLRLMPYVGQDLGGHTGQPDDELYVRFLQYGCLSPITRVHGTRREGLFRYPWMFGAEAAGIVRAYVKLRYRLLPMLYAAARRAYDDGTPLLRKLILEWPQLPEADRDDQYLLGDDLLVAPLVKPGRGGISRRKVWIPPGAWEDAWTGHLHAGPRTTSVACPLHQAPLYIRRGAILITAPEMEYTGQRGWDPVTLEVYPADGMVSRFLYEDDGETRSYQSGQWSRREMRCATSGPRTELTVAPPAGALREAGNHRQFRARFHLRARQHFRAVELDGTPVPASGYRLRTARDAPVTGPEIPLPGWGSAPARQASDILEIEFTTGNDPVRVALTVQ